MKKLALVPVLSTVVLLSTLSSGVAQAQTQGLFERGLAEARVAVRDAGSASAVGRIYGKYQRAAFFNCNVTFMFWQGVNVVYTPFKFAGNLTWGLVAGKDVIRMTTGDQGEDLNPQLKLATSEVSAMFRETSQSINGQHGSCTLAVEQMEIAKAEYNKRKGAELQTVIKVDDNTDLPVIVVPNQPSGKKN